MKKEKYAILKINSPLFKLFSDGRIPIKCFPEGTGQRGQEEADKYYGLNLSALGEEDTKQLHAILKDLRINADFRELEEKGLEILKEHILGVSCSEFKLF
jgi:hypothetical protein